MRPTFQRPARWFVDLGDVIGASLFARGWCGMFENGSTPEQALERMWDTVIRRSGNPEVFFLKYSCPPNVSIPGDDPQVWVRWSAERDDWMDIEPTAEMLRLRGIPADRIHPYARSGETIPPR